MQIKNSRADYFRNGAHDQYGINIKQYTRFGLKTYKKKFIVNVVHRQMAPTSGKLDDGTISPGFIRPAVNTIVFMGFPIGNINA